MCWPPGRIATFDNYTSFSRGLNGLDEEDIFYFGNAPGESGNADDNALVTVADLLLARNIPRDFPYPNPRRLF